MQDQSHVTNAPFKANDTEPYIFISYKHSDWRVVYPIIKRFHEAGFNIWYDAALRKGRNYDIQIANHIKGAALFITFITETVMKYANDEEDYVVKELSVAKDKKIERLPIFLDNVELDGFYSMHYSGKHSILKHQFGDNEDLFIEECITTFKFDYKIEPNKKDPEIEEPKKVSKPNSKQERLLDEINSLKDFENPPDDIVDKITDRIYQKYEDSARKYLADAYGIHISATYQNYEILYSKYGITADSFLNRLSNLKMEKPNFRNEAINRIKGLNSVGYDIADINDEREAIERFSEFKEKQLAIYNHYVWCRKNLNEGNEYGFEGLSDTYMSGILLGSVSSDTKIISPYQDSLLIWDELSNYERKGNIEFVNKIFEYLTPDLKIVKMKIIKTEERLKDLIAKGEKEIALDYDIRFDGENTSDIKIVDDDIVIDGNNHVIDANKKSRIFTIRAKNITIKNLTLKNGLTTHNGGATFIYQNGSCSFINCKFINNTASEGLFKVKSEGGAIYNEGFCSIDSCKFQDNKASNSDSKDIASENLFRLENSTFDGEAPALGMSILGANYSFRDPNSKIYRIAEKIHPFLESNISNKDFNSLSDEEYSFDERCAIRAMCIARVAGGTLIEGKCSQPLDMKEVDTYTTFRDAQKYLFVPIMESLGWTNGYDDYEKRTMNLTKLGGSLSDDMEENIIHKIVHSVVKSGLSFCRDACDEEPLRDCENDATADEESVLPKAYEGEDPYIFISYNHSDYKTVHPIIRQLDNAGFNIWHPEIWKAE